MEDCTAANAKLDIFQAKEAMLLEQERNFSILLDNAKNTVSVLNELIVGIRSETSLLSIPAPAAKDPPRRPWYV
eukprot:ANDGO_06523.mRNA.1 hypothetical protein